MMRTNQTRKTSLVLASIMLAGFLYIAPASAADHPFKDYDSNHDGKITMNEIMQHIRPRIQSAFNTLDRNKDGVLSSKDFDDVREGMKKFQDWLNELLRQFLPSMKEDKDKEKLHA